jgi:Uma2 family endonuclease
MASKTLIPVSEYLRMSFDGLDREYIDGEIIERSLGSTLHSKIQMRLLLFFHSLSDRHSLYIYPDLRVKLSGQRYRVPDIAVYFGNEPAENFPSRPPDVVVEVISEGDRHVDIIEKLVQYHAWGVKHIWSTDPWTHGLFVYDEHGYHQVPAFELPEFSARISGAELFADQTPQQ